MTTNILPRGHWRTPPVLCSTDTYTYSTQSYPMSFVRIAEKRIEAVLTRMGLKWRKVVDENTRANNADWRGWHNSLPNYRSHYEVRLSRHVRWETFAKRFLDEELAYYREQFGPTWAQRDDVDCWLAMARRADQEKN